MCPFSLGRPLQTRWLGFVSVVLRFFFKMATKKKEKRGLPSLGWWGETACETVHPHLCKLYCTYKYILHCTQYKYVLHCTYKHSVNFHPYSCTTTSGTSANSLSCYDTLWVCANGCFFIPNPSNVDVHIIAQRLFMLTINCHSLLLLVNVCDNASIKTSWWKGWGLLLSSLWLVNMCGSASATSSQWRGSGLLSLWLVHVCGWALMKTS